MSAGESSGAASAAAGIALVGCGRWGRHILRDLVGLGCTVAVADPSGEARQHAAAAGAASAVRDVAELPEVAGAVVATPTRTHAPVLESCCHAACRSSAKSR